MTKKQKDIQKMLDDCRITTEEYAVLQKAFEKLNRNELKVLSVVFEDL